MFPENVFCLTKNIKEDNIEEVLHWLAYIFDDSFETLKYFNKPALLKSLQNCYNNKEELANRFEQLYRQKDTTNLQFALKHIGYQATFDCYAKILSNNWFSTFGFADVINPWIAANSDLESTLALIAASKQICIEKNALEKIKQYDLVAFLKQLLTEYILWTPLQREELNHFYTNKAALESGEESLWGNLLRLTGNRVNICSIYANKDELFEAFMYHNPAQGKLYLDTIEDWIIQNENKFDELKVKLNALQTNEPPIEESENINTNSAQYLAQYNAVERPFIELAIQHNNAIVNLDDGINMMI